MDQHIVDAMFSLLRYELFSGDALLEEERPFVANNIEALYKLSKSHDLAHLIGDALSKQGFFSESNEWTKKFEKEQLLAIFRYEKINYELGELCGALEAAEIPFIPLKGSVIRKFYPEPWMRTSCDIDFLVHEEDLDRAIEYLVSNLGYKSDGKGMHDVSLTSQNGVHIELHYVLNELDNRVFDILYEVWGYATPVSSYKYALSDEFFYAYHIAHMAKHVLFGGCGIRPFVDLAIFERNLPCGDEKRDALLERGELLSFAQTARALSNAWLFGEPHNEGSLKLEKYILKSGVYGTIENRVAVHNHQRGGKIKYFLSRVFLKYDSMKYLYPILERHPWLLPFCEIHRWFKIAFDGRFKKSMNELKINNSISEEQARQTAEFLSDIGL